jgi:hypothetical protein
MVLVMPGTAPHLHFHLMDNSDLLEANGIPCAFEKYEVFQENTWATVTNGIPKANDRIRFFKYRTPDLM